MFLEDGHARKRLELEKAKKRCQVTYAVLDRSARKTPSSLSDQPFRRFDLLGALIANPMGWRRTSSANIPPVEIDGRASADLYSRIRIILPGGTHSRGTHEIPMWKRSSLLTRWQYSGFSRCWMKIKPAFWWLYLSLVLATYWQG